MLTTGLDAFQKLTGHVAPIAGMAVDYTRGFLYNIVAYDRLGDSTHKLKIIHSTTVSSAVFCLFATMYEHNRSTPE